MKRCRLKRYNFQIRNKMSKENKPSDKQENGNDFIADVIIWRSCLNDSPEIGQEIEILYDKGNGNQEVIKHKWTGWENTQWVMYCCKGWRACL